MTRDAANCGACGRVCPEAQVCAEGVCGCEAGGVDCGGTCIDPLTDPEHCGARGACSGDDAGERCEAMAICQDGQCRNDDPSLLSLEASVGRILPAFAPETRAYTLDLPAAFDSVAFLAVAGEGASILLNGAEVASGKLSPPIDVTLGSEVAVTVRVTAEAGAATEYVVIVRRGAIAYVKASNTHHGAAFGHAVSVQGDRVVVGSPGERSHSTGVNGDQSGRTVVNAGAAYVFLVTDGRWAQESYLKASNTGAGDSFGTSVAIGADTIAVGAPREASMSTGIDGDQENDGAPNSGAVYVFRRAESGWSQEAYVKASNARLGSTFGAAVALSADGNTMAVGAPYESSSSSGIGGDQSDTKASGSGAVYVFRRREQGWTQIAYVKASNPDRDDTFGYSVALSEAGDQLVVGAPGEGSAATGTDGNQLDNRAPRAGAVYSFALVGGVWSQTGYLKASNANASDLFGWSVAISGSLLAVGARGESSSSGANEHDNARQASGAVYLFEADGATWRQTAYLKADDPGELDNVGFSVAVSEEGGFVVAGAPWEDGSARVVNGPVDDAVEDSGAVYAFTRGADGRWAQTSYLKSKSSHRAMRLGHAVAVTEFAVVGGANDESGGSTGIDGDPDDASLGSSGAVMIWR